MHPDAGRPCCGPERRSDPSAGQVRAAARRALQRERCGGKQGQLLAHSQSPHPVARTLRLRDEAAEVATIPPPTSPSMSRSGTSRVSTPRPAFLPQFSTATTWHQNTFSSTQAVMVFMTKTRVALLPKLLTGSWTTAMTTERGGGGGDIGDTTRLDTVAYTKER
jgi:hypothetical protein